MNREQKSGYSIILACWGGFDFLFIIVNLLMSSTGLGRNKDTATHTHHDNLDSIIMEM